ncbi:hypothetical protein LEP1GSC150_0587 [Leptospira interrogans serovar Copenhageni str. LT2050]|uniref:Uncharacterized protein n=1 Tax=Leptospira interrogans serovar Copenhageni str. LT2050 TaxID=1001598 RepID=M3HRP8_LEPIT|nr:hypothetical protein LEP1GSC150_0587 [Leptospira interrogans serovar Copenhageni str. LT2050]
MIVTSFHSHLYLLPQFLAKKMSTFMLPGQTHDSEKKNWNLNFTDRFFKCGTTAKI